MDDWNKFPGNDIEPSETPINFTIPEKKKKTKEKFVTKKFFIFYFDFCNGIFSCYRGRRLCYFLRFV